VNTAEWEAMCDGCGKCCGLATTGIACPSLDTKKNRCRNYDIRLTKEMCVQLTPENVLELHEKDVLPASCAYVRHEKGEPPLDSPPRAELVEFEVAPPVLKELYLKQREEWFKAGSKTRGEGGC